MSVLAGSRGKLAEARFFLALLRRIENGQPATTDSLDNEATYFNSALLNACYSVLQHLRKQGKRALRAAQKQESKGLVSCLDKEVDTVLQRNRILYNEPKRGAQSEEWGLRHLSVHHEIVDAQHHDYTMGTYGSAPYGRLRYGETRLERRLYVERSPLRCACLDRAQDDGARARAREAGDALGESHCRSRRCRWGIPGTHTIIPKGAA